MVEVVVVVYLSVFVLDVYMLTNKLGFVCQDALILLALPQYSPCFADKKCRAYR